MFLFAILKSHFLTSLEKRNSFPSSCYGSGDSLSLMLQPDPNKNLDTNKSGLIFRGVEQPQLPLTPVGAAERFNTCNKPDLHRSPNTNSGG